MLCSMSAWTPGLEAPRSMHKNERSSAAAHDRTYVQPRISRPAENKNSYAAEAIICNNTLRRRTVAAESARELRK
jgi:hypothetical protein